jgi:dTDP-4-dehydrorhamnose reductase
VIHISTDYVFDGTSAELYDENAPVKPLNNYGESKLRGERALLKVIPTNAYVVRTSWLYGLQGKNFVKTMTSKALREEPVQVVDDQVGSPTSARDLAEAVISIINNLPESGIYNFSNNGKCSWFELAQVIYREVGADEKLVKAMKSSSLELKAKRPKNSLLSKEKWEMASLCKIADWQISLKSLLPEIMREIDREARP